MSKNKHSKNKSTTRIRLSKDLIETINHIAKFYDISLHEAIRMMADDTIHGLGIAVNSTPSFESKAV